MDTPLTLDFFFRRAESLFPHKELVTATATGIERSNYGEWTERTRRLGGAIEDLGVSEYGRVGTFAWNTTRTLFRGALLQPGITHAQYSFVC